MSRGRQAPGDVEGGFSRRVPGWMVGVAVASLLAAVLVSAFGGSLGARGTARPSTWSEGALGHRALFELLAAEGFGVVTRQSRAGLGLGPRRPLVLAEPDADAGPRRRADGAVADSYERDALARGAAVVLVLPKWLGEPDPAHPGWVAGVELLPADEVLSRVERVLGAPPVEGLRLRRITAGGEGAEGGLACRVSAAGEEAANPPADPDSWAPSVDLTPAQLIVPGAELLPVVACRGGWLAALRPGTAAAPPMLLVADPDLLNNQGLGRADHAALVVHLLAVELRARGAVFDETIHGYSRPTGLLAEALRPPLLPATLHGLLVTALVLWAGSARLGKPLPALRPPAPGKTVLIDNTAELLARGGHAADSLARYYRYTLQTVGAHFFLPPDLPPAALAARLERLSPRAGGSGPLPAGRGRLAAIERRIAELGAGATGRRAEERAAALARGLYRWRREMMDGAREGR